jgi:hypothetical protein
MGPVKRYGGRLPRLRRSDPTSGPAPTTDGQRHMTGTEKQWPFTKTTHDFASGFTNDSHQGWPFTKITHRCLPTLYVRVHKNETPTHPAPDTLPTR